MGGEVDRYPGWQGTQARKIVSTKQSTGAVMSKLIKMNRPVIGITTDIEEEYIKLKQVYCDAVIAAGGVPILIPPASNAIHYAEIINGLIIPGGHDIDPAYYHEQMLPQVKPVSRRRSDSEISLLQEVINFRKPVLGICYGMQMINVFFGGTLYQDIDSQLSVEINHKKDYHIIVIAENRFLKKGTFSVNSTHHQAIKKLGNGLSAFAYSGDNLIEAFYKEDYGFLVGVQWHPERMAESELSFGLFKSFIEASGVGQ
jgi:putative glutamine amidotransferase